MASYYEKAVAAFDARRFDEAEHFFGSAVRDEPGRPRVAANRARCLVRLHRLDAALEAAQHAVALDPHDGYLLLALIEVLSALERDGELLAVAARAAELTPDTQHWLADGLVEHAWKLVARERCQDAEDVASASLEVQPTTGGYAVLAGALAERNRWGDARHAIDEALRLSVDEAEVQDLHRRGGLIDKGLQSLRDAVAELDARIAAEPKSAELWMEKGDHLHAMGRLDEAALAHQRGSELQATHSPSTHPPSTQALGRPRRGARKAPSGSRSTASTQAAPVKPQRASGESKSAAQPASGGIKSAAPRAQRGASPVKPTAMHAASSKVAMKARPPLPRPPLPIVSVPLTKARLATATTPAPRATARAATPTAAVASHVPQRNAAAKARPRAPRGHSPRA